MGSAGLPLFERQTRNDSGPAHIPDALNCRNTGFTDGQMVFAGVCYTKQDSMSLYTGTAKWYGGGRGLSVFGHGSCSAGNLYFCGMVYLADYSLSSLV